MRSNERHSWIPLHYHVHPPASTFLSPVPSTQPCDETNTAAQTRTHTVRESPESWDWIKSFSPFSSSFHGFLPTEREEGRHSQSQRSEEWPSLTDRPGDWNTNQPFPAIGLGSAPAALLGRLAEAVAKIKKLLITTARITGQAWKSLWTCCRSATIVSVLLQDKVLRQAK